MKFKFIKAKPNSYGPIRNIIKPKRNKFYVVVHFTANKGDTALNNANYFAKVNKRYAGVQYITDERDIIYKSVPVSRVAWAVGGSKYWNCNQTGGGKFYGKCTNYNSINIEMCNSVTRNAKVEANTIWLIRFLMKKYNIDKSHVIRHFDVTGKNCPASLCNDKAWKDFLSKI